MGNHQHFPALLLFSDIDTPELFRENVTPWKTR
jgi:hypothetical protein